MRYRNQRYLDEIADEGTDDEHVLSEQTDLPPANAEEESWKKRYGDLRRKAQADATTLEGRMKALETQLAEASKGTVKMPKSEAEVAAWVKQYPDVADIFKTMIMQETGSRTDEISSTRQELQDLKHERELEKALQELLKEHPDFLEIRSTVDFIDWAKDQPKWINKALYDEDEIDVPGAIRAIDLYKMDTQKQTIKAAPAPSRDLSAATSVRTPRTESPTASNGGAWSESRVEALGRKEYDRYSDEIDAAIRSGKFVYDLTAGAR